MLPPHSLDLAWLSEHLNKQNDQNSHPSGSSCKCFIDSWMKTQTSKQWLPTDEALWFFCWKQRLQSFHCLQGSIHWNPINQWDLISAKCLAYFHANLHNTNKHKHTHTHKSGTVWTDRTKRRQYNNDQLSVSFLPLDNRFFFFTFSITNLVYKSGEWVQCLSATISKRSERWLLLEH